MLRLEKINGKNVWDILKLSVNEDQREFVASNDVSIIEAYTTITNNGYVFPFGIYDEDILVGFVMIGYDKDDYWDDAPQIADNNYNLWRLMIDKRYQQKGYGRKAIELALEFIKTFPCGRAEYCWLSYEPDNKVAKNLYESFGFEETGEMDGEEIIEVLTLREQEIPTSIGGGMNCDKHGTYYVGKRTNVCYNCIHEQSYQIQSISHN